MKIIALGGAGDMGSRAVEDMANTEGVKKITIADRNLAAAESLATRLSATGVEIAVKKIDADNHAGLVEAIRGHDVAASALGPFHKFESKLVSAAVEAGVHYASICDEWEAASEVIEKYGSKAREKDLTVITGLGTSPGFTNVGARYLAGKFDKLKRLDVNVYQPLAGGGGPAVIGHMLFIMSGKIAVWRDGKRILVPALSDAREVEFPQFGKIKLWRMGHSEPETVPRFLPGIEEVNFFMGYGRGAGFLVTPAKMGLFAGPRRQDIANSVISWLEKITRVEPPEKGAVRIDGYGEKGGREEHQVLCGIGEMREATGLSLSVGAIMIGRKELLTEEGGVCAPEACIEPSIFINRIQQKGIKIYEDLEMKKELKI